MLNATEQQMGKKVNQPKLKVVDTNYTPEAGVPVQNIAHHLQSMFSRMRVATLFPGDTIVLTLHQHLPDRNKNEICDAMQELFQDTSCKVIVLNHGDHIDILRGAMAQQAAARAQQQKQTAEVLAATENTETDGVWTCTHPRTPIHGTGDTKEAAQQDFLQKVAAPAAQPAETPAASDDGVGAPEAANGSVCVPIPPGDAA